MCIPVATPACSIYSARSAFRKSPIAHAMCSDEYVQGADSPAGLHKSLLLAHPRAPPANESNNTQLPWDVGSEGSERTRSPSTTFTVGSESSGRTESVLPGGTLCLANGVATTRRSVSHLQATRSAFRKVRGGTYHQHHQSQCNLSRGVWGNLLVTYPVLLGGPGVASAPSDDHLLSN
jgi:hypothetical protein